MYVPGTRVCGVQLQSKDETNDGLYTDIVTLEEAYVLVGHGWAQ